MIKAIIFDFGGVISSEPSLSKFCESFAKENELNKDQFKYIFLEHWVHARIGNIKTNQFWEGISAQLSISPTKLRRAFFDYFSVKEEALEFVLKLKKKYKTAILTNSIEDWFEEIKTKYLLKRYFDAIVTSYEEKMAKPDVLLFRHTAQKLGVNPDDCLYVDDMKDNLLAAQKVGMHTIQFKDLRNLKTELMMYGIKLM
ncbi:MAG TPA: HAD family phosphatase [Candidatus Nanoarchaeia archaeon]|nr:HAD family phosphatase [Candidatus Nanoarchaeia archaeon]